MAETQTAHTRDSLLRDMKQLGIEPGDTLFIHSSYKSLGPIEGGAQAVVEAFEQAVGPDGLVMMPSFNLVSDRLGTWNIETTPSTVGYLTEYFRTMPGTVRSDHYSHSVAARGKDAAWIVADHRSTRGMRSTWDGTEQGYGHCYGSDAPMIRAYDRGGRLIMLGVTYQSSTYMHVVECRWWNHTLESDPNVGYHYVDRDKLGEYWEEQGRVTFGNIGDAAVRMCSIPDFVDTLAAAVIAAPARFFKGWT